MAVAMWQMMGIQRDHHFPMKFVNETICEILKLMQSSGHGHTL